MRLAECIIEALSLTMCRRVVTTKWHCLEFALLGGSTLILIIQELNQGQIFSDLYIMMGDGGG